MVDVVLALIYGDKMVDMAPALSYSDKMVQMSPTLCYSDKSYTWSQHYTTMIKNGRHGSSVTLNEKIMDMVP